MRFVRLRGLLGCRGCLLRLRRLLCGNVGLRAVVVVCDGRRIVGVLFRSVLRLFLLHRL